MGVLAESDNSGKKFSKKKIMTKVVKKVFLIGKSLHYLSRICKYIISSVVISAENMLVLQTELIFL